MKLFTLEWKQLLRSKFIYVLPSLFFVTFGVFFLLNTHDNVDNIWRDKHEQNRFNSQAEAGVMLGATEEQIKFAEEQKKEKYQAYQDVLLSGYERDRKNYPKDYLKTLDYWLKEKLDPENFLFFQKQKIFYEKIVKNKNKFIFDSPNPYESETHKPTLNLFRQNFMSFLPTNYLFLFISLLIGFLFYQFEHRKSKELFGILPVATWKKTWTRISFSYFFLALSFFIPLGIFFIANSALYGLGEWNYPVVVQLDKYTPKLITQADFLGRFLSMFMLFLLFIVLFNYAITKWTKSIIPMFLLNSLLFLSENIPFLDNEKMVKYKEWFIGSFSNIAKIILCPEVRGEQTISMNGFYPTYPHSLKVLTLSIGICVLLVILSKWRRKNV